MAKVRVSRQIEISREEMEHHLRKNYLEHLNGIYKFRNDAIEFWCKEFSQLPVVVDTNDISKIIKSFKEVPPTAKVTEIIITPHRVKATAVWYEYI